MDLCTERDIAGRTAGLPYGALGFACCPTRVVGDGGERLLPAKILRYAQDDRNVERAPDTLPTADSRFLMADPDSRPATSHC
jgi:hypothetical protein